DAEEPDRGDQVRHREDPVDLDLSQAGPLRVLEQLGHRRASYDAPVSQSSIPPSARDAAGAPATEPSVFTRIIEGELPGRFVWRDEQVVAFLTIAPIRPGHVLVVPIQQIDRWTEVPPRLWGRVMDVAH